MFRERLKKATEEAVLFGVRWGVVLLILTTAYGWLVVDYLQTRNNAGRAYNEFLTLYKRYPALAVDPSPKPQAEKPVSGEKAVGER